MRISTNMIGNYNPQVSTGNVKHAKANTIPPKVEAKNTSNKVETSLSQDEKKYFIDLYPQNKNEITGYHFYQKSGKMSGVKIGSMFDKRG